MHPEQRAGEACATENDLLAFADGQLSGERHTWVEAHVDTCQECAGLLAELLRDDDLEAPPESPPESPRDGDDQTTAVDLGELSIAPGPPPQLDAASRLRAALETETAYGLRVGRYVLLERLGVGGMGFVYTAHDPELTRSVAIKLLRPELDHGSRARGSARARLLREAQAAARLKHPNVVTVYEAGEADGIAFIAMEYVEGASLRRWIQADGAGPRPWREVLRVFLQAGEGLAAAHRAGVLHRDFKPDNVLIDGDGRVQVADFGLAAGVDPKEASDEPRLLEDLVTASHSSLDMRMTLTGSVLGTPAYMSPEQHATAQVDARADQYGFAVSLYEALYGVRPFSGKSLRDLLEAKVELRLRERADGRAKAKVPRWLRAVLLRALAPQAQDRWPDMEAMLAALRENPSMRRAAWAVVATLAAGALVGLSWQAHARSEIAAACEAEGQAIYELWTEPRKQAMAASFEATGLSFAADSWSRVRDRVDDYTHEYAQARTELCRDGELERRVEPELLARARECFDTSHDALARAVADWEAADEQHVSRAPGRPLGFPTLSDCTSFDVLARRLALEKATGVDPETYAALRAEYHDARKLAHGGDMAASRDEAASVAARAAEAGALSLASAASLTECDALVRLDQADEARVVCERSFMEAVRSSDHEGGFHTGAALSNLASQYRRDRESAELWLDLAEAHLSFIALPPDQPDPQRARLYAAKGYLAQDFDEHELALSAFREAVDSYTQVHGETSELASYLLLSIAVISMKVDDPEAAADAVSRAAAIRDAVYGPNHPASLEVHLYRASILHESDPPQADVVFEQTLARVIETSGPASVLTATAYIEWGRSLHEREGCGPARDKAEAALAILEAHPKMRPEWLPQVYNLASACRLEAGDAPSALEIAQTSVEFFGEDVDPEAAGEHYAKALALVEDCIASLEPTAEDAPEPAP